VAATVIAKQALPIACEEDVLVVRRAVKVRAMARQFDAFASAAITTATSELTRNTWLHGGGGSAEIEEIMDGERIGLRVQFRDTGPGIPDIDRVLRGGYSTTRTLGLGLSGSRRLVDTFSIESTVGQGTVITIVKWKPG
jgi:serine/threonine-protein kinase RsbT